MSERYDPQSYWSERLKTAERLRGVGYSVLSASYNDWLYRARLRNLEVFARKHGINWPDTRILDIGFGTGFFEAYYEKKGAKELHGVDINTATIAAVRERFHQFSFENADITEHALERENYFDLATLFAVIFHIVDDEKLRRAFTNLHRAIRPGGLFLLTGQLVGDNVPPQRLAHVKARSFKEVSRLLSEVGFEVVDNIPVASLLNAPLDWDNAVVRKVVPKLWRWGVRRSLGRFETSGWAIGALLYGLDGILMKCSQRGRSEKLLIARKK